ECVQRHESFDEQVCELHEESELSDADDQAAEVFADAVLHEFCLFPFHQFTFGVVGTTFGLAGFVGDRVKFFQRNRPGLGWNGFSFAALGPGRGGNCVAWALSRRNSGAWFRSSRRDLPLVRSLPSASTLG